MEGIVNENSTLGVRFIALQHAELNPGDCPDEAVCRDDAGWVG